MLGQVLGDWVPAGLGIGLASLWFAGPDIRAGRLVPILPQYPVWPEAKIWAVRPPGRIMPARVNAFLDYMQGRIIQTNAQRYGCLLDETGVLRTDL